MTLGSHFLCGRKTRPSIIRKYLSTKSSCTDAKTNDLKYVADGLVMYFDLICHSCYTELSDIVQSKLTL